jgi:hypothetical protein
LRSRLSARRRGIADQELHAPQRNHPGFNPDNVLAMRLTLPPGKYKQGEPRAQIYKQLIDQVKTTPGVQSAAAVLSLPLGGDTFNVWRGVIREGRPMTPDEQTNAQHLVITPDYFQTLQIPLKAGRTFTDQDNLQSTKVVIVNETMARQLWPGENPIGKRFTVWRDEKFPREVVGVVGDTKSIARRRTRTTDVRALRAGSDVGQSFVRCAHERVSRLRLQDQCAKRFARSTKLCRITT